MSPTVFTECKASPRGLPFKTCHLLQVIHNAYQLSHGVTSLEAICLSIVVLFIFDIADIGSNYQPGQ